MCMESHHQSPALPQQPQVLESKNSRNSLQFFIDLRENLTQKFAFPMSSRDIVKVLEKIREEHFYLDSISEELEKRPKRHITRSVQDLFRINSEKAEKSGALFKKIKTKDLEEMRVASVDYIEGNIHGVLFLDDIPFHELTEYVSNLLKKYKKQKVSELFDPETGVDTDELYRMIIFIKDSVAFRQRKINEYVAYRYARVAPPYLDLEEFLCNVHRIFAPGSSEEINAGFYRENATKIGGGYGIVDYQEVPDFMHKFAEDDRSFSSGAREKKREALRKYLLLEWVHPFRDGNGRCGRALFVYLQRKYGISDKDRILHIPIARREVGTDRADEAPGEQILGSLSLTVSYKVTSIFTLLAEKERRGMSYEDMVTALNESSLEKEIDELLDQIESQAVFDTRDSSDWKDIFNAAESALKNKV